MNESLVNPKFAEMLDEARKAYEADDFQRSYALSRSVVDNLIHGYQGYELAAKANYYTGLSLQELAQFTDAIKYLEQAIALYESNGDEFGSVLGRLALVKSLRWRGEITQALDTASLAIATAREHGFKEAEARALASVGNIAWMRGDRKAAIGDLERALRLFIELGKENEVTTTRSTLGYVLVLDGQVSAGQKLIQESIEVFRSKGNLDQMAKAISNLAYVHYTRGELPEARDLLLQAVELEDPGIDPRISLSSWYNLGLIELRSGWFDSARRSFTRSLFVAENLGDQVIESMSRFYLGVLDLYIAEFETALERFEYARGKLTELNVAEKGLGGYYLAVHALATGDEQRARAEWGRLDPVESLRDCLDDFRILSSLLDFLSKTDQPGFRLQHQARYTAASLGRELQDQVIRLEDQCS